MPPEHMTNFKSDSSSDAELLEAEEAIARNKQFQQIHSAIASLKWKYQTALTLRYFEDLSIREIARILKISENTVKTHIHRGLKLLKW